MASNDGWEDVPVAAPTQDGWDDVPLALPKQATPTLDALGTGLQHFSRHATAGLGDKMTAGIAALSDVWHDKTGKRTLGDAYRGNLAFLDKTMEASDVAHPTARWVGNTAGVVTNAAALGLPSLLRGGAAAAAPQVAPTLLRRALASAKVGGALGGVGGFGSSRADTLEDTLGDVEAGAMGGAVLGGALPVAGAGVSAGARAVAPGLANALERAGISAGRRALTSGADTLSKRGPVDAAAVRQALQSGAIRPFGTATGAQARLEAQEAAAGAELNGILARLEASGVRGPDARQLAGDMANEGAALRQTSYNRALPREYERVADDTLQKMDGNGEIPLRNMEELKRSLQKMARYGDVTDTPLNETRQDIASMVRQRVEDSVRQQAHLAPAEAAAFVPAKDSYGNIAEALGAASRGAAREAQRSGGMGKAVLTGLVGHSALGPAGWALGVGSKLMNNRWASTAATGATGLANVLRGGGATQQAMVNALRSAAPTLRTPAAALPAQGFAEWLASNPQAAMQAQIAALREKRPEALAQGELP